MGEQIPFLTNNTKTEETRQQSQQLAASLTWNNWCDEVATPQHMSIAENIPHTAASTEDNLSMKEPAEEDISFIVFGPHDKQGSMKAFVVSMSQDSEVQDLLKRISLLTDIPQYEMWVMSQGRSLAHNLKWRHTTISIPSTVMILPSNKFRPKMTLTSAPYPPAHQQQSSKLKV